MKLFKKADEMEMSINFRAMRLAWVFSNLALLVWAVVSVIKDTGDYTILTTIISLQNILFFGSKLYMTHKMSAEANEE